ncbi:thiamine-phosphate kinase [Legionella sp. CNM-4043-24]|uniref:thiamine-phosphate kinase n=1 Tax=Legionella sp. CNM-4043-24 TaxID=3421646 RepID=UPI00403B1345
MNEFSLIDVLFKQKALKRDDVVFGIGDDAACLLVPPEHHLLVSTDTLVDGVHFLNDWDPFDIAWRAVMVNVSDMAAMAATPCWLSLALTLPDSNEAWLTRFAEGLHAALRPLNISLIGGDTTRGPLSITITVHGVTPAGSAVTRQGARRGDTIWVSGELGAAAMAVSILAGGELAAEDRATVMNRLLRPSARIDLQTILRTYATAALDISDGLSADLNHICEASGLGAYLSLASIPVHPLLKQYCPEKALDFALSGGDDYELCFTSSPDNTPHLLADLAAMGLSCYPVGYMIDEPGLRCETGLLAARGYTHFQD